eukprot:399031-Pelagomonas_calceolata.AAC.1
MNGGLCVHGNSIHFETQSDSRRLSRCQLASEVPAIGNDEIRARTQEEEEVGGGTQPGGPVVGRSCLGPVTQACIAG